jgi:cell division protein FtsI (penicillin-binding protein 3)
MRGMMEDVVLEGTGKPAQLNGYTAAGKSGTAQKIDPATGRYSATQYNSSFAGFAPVNEPAVSILVVLDSPVGAHHGGEVGGPVFKRVAEQVLTYLAVPHDIPTPSDVETAKNTKGGPNRVAAKRQEEQLAAAERVSAAMTEQHDLEKSADAHVNDSSPQTVAFSGADGIPVPSLTGRTVRAVSEECERVGLVPALVGSGVAVEQFPGAGSLVPPGSRVTVRFGRPGVLLPTAAHGAQN